jgi:hypothetical protein
MHATKKARAPELAQRFREVVSGTSKKAATKTRVFKGAATTRIWDNIGKRLIKRVASNEQPEHSSLEISSAIIYSINSESDGISDICWSYLQFLEDSSDPGELRRWRSDSLSRK